MPKSVPLPPPQQFYNAPPPQLPASTMYAVPVVHVAAAPPPLAAEDGKWPLVLFSHGLGGCEEMYSQLCSFIASYGYIVVAVEHEVCVPLSASLPPSPCQLAV